MRAGRSKRRPCSKASGGSAPPRASIASGSTTCDPAVDLHHAPLLMRVLGELQSRRSATERPLHDARAEMGARRAAQLADAVLEHDTRFPHRLVVVADRAEELLGSAAQHRVADGL